MEKHNYSITDNILRPNNYIFKSQIPDDIKLNDLVISYFNGNRWRIVPLSIIFKFPIIYDKYANDHETLDISVCICPFTLTSCVLQGKYIPSEFVENYCLCVKAKDEHIIPLFSNYEQKLKIWEVEIKIFKNVLVDHPNCEFFYLIDAPNVKQIFDSEYLYNKVLPFDNIKYDDKYHPKSLVHVVNYCSSKNDEIKETIIIGKDISKNKITGYDNKSSAINKYIESQELQLSEKQAFITPIFWFSCKHVFPKAKIVNL
jgi:hypothetical protein